MLIILTGKSCAGKDTLKKAFLEKGTTPLLSDTTRPMREGEKDGVDYNFKKDFNKDDYIEFYEFSDMKSGKKESVFYGTPKKELDNDRTYIAIKDKTGAEALKNYYGKENVFVAYLDIPYELRRRRSFIRDNGYKDKEWSHKWNIRALRDDTEFRDIYKVADIIYDKQSLDDPIYAVEKTFEYIENLKKGNISRPAEFGLDRFNDDIEKADDKEER